MKNFWPRLAKIKKKLSKQDLLSLAILFFLLLTLPLALIAVSYQAYQRSRATGLPATPPIPSPNPINWQTETVSLQADDFYIIADGRKYLAQAADLRISSDPGDAHYTTLEATWHEHGREMRLFMYFHATEYYWWSTEIRTYNGQVNPNWIVYKNAPQAFFVNNLGLAFTSPEFTLFSDDAYITPVNQYQGVVFFKNLRLQAFLNRFITTPTPTPQACIPYTCEPNSWSERQLGVFTKMCQEQNTPECLRFDHNCDGKIETVDLQYIHDNCLVQPTPTAVPSAAGCKAKGGVCCKGDYSICVKRLINPWNPNGTINDSGGCNPDKVYPGFWCCRRCR